MSRLFVAISLSAAVKEKLVNIQPGLQTGMRPMPVEQIHLILHFIGETEVEPITTALEKVKCTCFLISLAGVGQFRTADGEKVIWAGVNLSDELVHLHRQIKLALLAVTRHNSTGR